jgi:Mg2+/citrate symporter
LISGFPAAPAEPWAGTVDGVLSALALDPTGLSSPIGRLVILAGLVAALVLLLRWWWHNRGR